MVLGVFMAILDIQIVASSLEQIQAGLSATRDEITWVQTAYLVAEVVVIPLSGWLARAFSTRILFVLACGGFTLMSLLCVLAWNLPSMVAFRASRACSAAR
ncbi:MFS transporter [Methylogaea oryzae]|uniref:MFS transporter n=1 Tax=Methylogaea oryzae TaxID=1295382 RepID=UPI000A528021|nr:MFS transporter [Methylogaea oryzae]